MPDTGNSAIAIDEARRFDRIEVQRQQALLKTEALQNATLTSQSAILTSANFSIIATDEKGVIHSPGISGIRALRMLAEDRTAAHIPVIAVSANAMPRDIENGVAAGFFKYLSKPIKTNEFMDTLDEALRFAKAASTATTRKEHAS